MVDGAEYLIAIGAVMTGGDASIAQLGKLESKLIASDPAVDKLEAALKQASTAMAQTGAASDAAASELALAERAYKRLSNEAKAADRALAKAAAGGGGIPPAVQQRADAASAALRREGASLDAAREKARQAAVAHSAMASSVDKLGKATEKAEASEESFGGKLKAVASQALAAAKAIYSVGSAIATKFVIPAMQAHDDLVMMRARLDALAGGTVAGGKVQVMLRDLAAEVGSTDEALAPLAVKLMAIGVPVDSLRDKVKMLAAQEALGMGGTDAVIQVLTKLGDKLKLTSTDMGWLKEDFTQLAKTSGVTGEAIAGEMGMSVAQLDEQLKAGSVDAKRISDAITKLATAKGMPVLEAQAKTFDAKLAQVKNSAKQMFAGIDTGPIIGAMNQVAKAFDPTTASGKAMGESIATAFSTIAGAAATAIPMAIKGLEMLAKAAGVVVNALDAASRAFGDLEAAGTTKTEAIPEASETDNPELIAYEQKLKAEKQYREAAASAAAAGKAAAAGFQQGLVAGTPAAVSAASSLASASINAMKSALDASSPSRKFMQLGRWSGEGYVLGMQQSRPIESALASISMPAAANTNVATSTRQSISLTGPFYFYGVEDADDAEARFSALLTRAIEGDVQQLGAGEVAA